MHELELFNLKSGRFGPPCTHRSGWRLYRDCNGVVLLEHLLQRQLEHLVACSVDQWIDADVDETEDARYVEPPG